MTSIVIANLSSILCFVAVFVATRKKENDATYDIKLCDWSLCKYALARLERNDYPEC